ncbi:hypothetical protein DSM106972_046780 [Dulcicalothrix desertica PCC 7102]|jgi:hypothetical protein|uniref:Uncharacterized protein n=2 Tax=Dulcicalothrix desertica TaxID=32056 RepID=A0A3S1CKE1_9CYAN|nr:hypothetical protein DSM106972_046780 [Dulcicalothrix desertica PCC 7102]TWH51300.1 hypothetical protein CAL7102_05701 [Dulcicalothrix desertica PCC 7102]
MVATLLIKNRMTTVTLKEIAQFRSQLSEDPLALKALDAIEDCEGDLEDAAMTLAIRVGQQPERANSEWLDALARKWRAVICQQEFRSNLQDGSIQEMMQHIRTMPTFPSILAAPVLMYVMKQGIDNFCEPFDSLK